MPARIVILLLLLAASAAAQTGASALNGTVSDPSGAAVSAATVTARNDATAVTYHQSTTLAGLYSFPAIPAGSYSLTVQAPRFKTIRRPGTVLQAATPLDLDFKLEIGDAAETVTVSSAYHPLQTSSAALGNVVEQRAIASLPLNGRNPLTLIVLEPGVLQRPGNQISVNGARSQANNVTIDGIDANESSFSNPTNNVFRLTPGAVQEYKVTTSNATADEGRNSGASVAVATRSGTNEIHGRLFYFLRNTALNANEFFAKAQGNAKPDIKLNQYGFEAGGPLRKNRTFLFGSWQGQQINYAQSVDAVLFGNVGLYTPAARSGVYRYWVPDPKNPFLLDGQRITQNSPLLVDASTGALKSGVRTCASPSDLNCVASYNLFAADPRGIGADKSVSALLNSYPAPNSYAAGDGLNTGVYVWIPPIRVRGPQYMARLDHYWNGNNTLFARYLAGDNRSLNGDPLNGRPQVLPGFPPRGEVFRPAKNAALGWRRVVSPRIVNEFTAGFARFEFLFTRGEANPRFPDVPPFTFNNSEVDYTTTPRSARTVNTIQYLDNLSVVSGAHQFRFGANIRLYQHNDQRGDLGGGNVTPATSLSRSLRPPQGFVAAPGITSADNVRLQGTINDLLGIPARIQQIFLGDLKSDAFLPYRAGPNAVTLWNQGQRLKQYNFYAQDEWHATRSLTFNYGLRWEINPAPTEAGGRAYIPNRRIDGREGPVTFVPSGRWFRNNNLGAIAPRLGLAWSPGADQKTVLRAGYGIAFDALNSFQVTAVAMRVPGQQFTCSSTPGGATTPGCQSAPDVRLGQGFPVELAPPTVKPSSFLTPPAQTLSNAPAVTVFDQNLRVPTVHQWNFVLQRELPAGFVASAAYVGRRGTRLYRSFDVNQIDATPILPSFLAMQRNVAAGCKPDGSGCAAGVPIPIVQQGVVNAAFVNSSGSVTDLSQNAAGEMVTRIEQTTLSGRYRPNPQFERITYLDNGGDSSYHGLQLTLHKRFDAGLLLSAAYSLSKSIDNQSLDPVGVTGGGGLGPTAIRTPADARDFSNERGRSDFDNRHVFSMTGVYDLPFGRNRFFGGWSLNGLAVAMSGEPFSVRSGVRTANSSSQSRAALTGAAPVALLQDKPGVVGPVLFQDASAFAIPQPGASGIGRNTFQGPGFWNIDLGLSKSFAVAERYHLVFRSEFFNALNHPNFNNPRDATSGNPSILSPVFAQTCCTTMSTASSSNVLPQGESWRVIQFALKLEF